MVVPVLVTFFAEILMRFSSIVTSDHSNCSHQAHIFLTRYPSWCKHFHVWQSHHI